MLSVLGIDVSSDLLERWVDWLAPDEQPFFLTVKESAEWELPVDDAREATADQRMQREPFEQWLADHTVAGGRDDVPGTVFVWRDGGLAVQHAAVTIGDGWMVHKPSQSWMTPRKVRSVGEVKRSTRTAGWRLQRRRVQV